jgi:uncharacterized protein YjlB
MPSSNSTTPGTLSFADDGSIPNNLALPFMRYRGGIDFAGSPKPEKLIEKTFAENGSGEMLRNGMYPYAYPYARYHSTIHEAMGVARAKVHFGGDKGHEIEIVLGDVVILPAGTGRQCLTQSPDLTVIRDYPPTGKFDLRRGSKAEQSKALAAIPKVPQPVADPVSGPEGPPPALWPA